MNIKHVSYGLFLLVILTSAAQAQSRWERVPGPPGGSIYDIAMEGDTIMVQEGGGFFFRSEDRGASWVLVPAVDAHHMGDFTRIFFAFGQWWVLNRHAGSLYRYGWERGWARVELQMNFGLHDARVFDGNVVSADDYKGFLVCEDPEGMIWTSHNDSLPRASLSAIARMLPWEPGEYIVSASDKRLYRGSGDSAWIPLGLPQLNWEATAIAHTGRSYLAMVPDAGLLQSVDGMHWDTVMAVVPARMSRILVDDSLVIVNTHNGLQISTDAGVSWREERLGLSYIQPMDVEIQGEFVIVSSEGYGVFLSHDRGATWERAPLRATYAFDVIEHNGTAHMTTHFQAGIYRREAGDWNWRHIPESSEQETNTLRTVLSHDGVLYYATFAPSLLISEDDGGSWTRTTFPRVGWPPVLCAHGNTVFLSRDRLLMHSSDRGLTWDSTTVPGNNIYAMASVDQYLYVSAYPTIRSSDEGRSWEVDTLGTGQEAFQVLAELDGTLFGAGNNSVIHYKTPADARWLPAALPDSLYPHRGVAMYGHSPYLYASDTRSRIFLWSPAEKQWQPWEEGLPEGVEARLVGIAEGYLWANVEQYEIWRRPLSGPVSVGSDDFDPLPAAAVLHQNYPNPFNPATTISYELPREMMAALIVTDALGREVWRAAAPGAAQRSGGGRHSVTFNASDLPPGMYFYRLETEGAVHVRKMVVVR